jgi:hypothetical protein
VVISPAPLLLLYFKIQLFSYNMGAGEITTILYLFRISLPYSLYTREILFLGSFQFNVIDQIWKRVRFILFHPTNAIINFFFHHIPGEWCNILW